MLKPADLYTIVCRPALPMDTADVIELTRTIWEGEDYVPAVWDEWLADYSGLLLIAEYGGHVVGLGKLTQLAPGEWWMEGLRVHPDYAGLGVASHIHDYQQAYWEKVEGEVVRLVTVSYREAVKHLCQRTGFTLLGELTSFSAPAIASANGSFRKLLEAEVEDALRFTSIRAESILFSNLIDEGWQWAELSAHWLTRAARAGHAWWWRHTNHADGLILLRTGDEDESEALFIRYLLCSLGDMAACLRELRHLAASLGYRELRWIAPLSPELITALEEAGFQRDWDETLHLYQKKRSR